MNQSLPSYPNYKPASLPWLAQVPAHWEVIHLGALLKERNQNNNDGKVNQVLSVMKDRGVILYADKGNVGNKMSEDITRYKLVEPGDLVLNSMNVIIGSAGLSRYIGCLSPVYYVLTPRTENLSIEYASWIFKDRIFQQSLVRIGNGILAHRMRIPMELLKREGLPIPPILEQQRIVAFLEAKAHQIARLLRAKRQLIKLLQEQKQATILRVVTKGVNYKGPRKNSGVTWLGEVPTHWETVAISRIAKVGNGSTPSRATPEYWFGGDYPWLNSSHANRDLIDSCDQFVTPKALAECHLPRVPAGSVLVAITGQGKTRGKAALLGMEATINQHVAYITPKQKITPEYLHLVLTAAYSTLRSISEDAGSTKGALTCADLKRFKIAFPSIPEQKQLLEAVEKETHLIDETIDRAQREIELIQEYRTRLVADVVTGRVDVRHLTIAIVASLPEEDDLLDEEEVDEDELIEETLETDG